MVIYFVRWDLNRDQVSFPNRVKHTQFCFTDQCRNSKDAMFVAEWYFRKELAPLNPSRNDITFSDGIVTLQRQKVDSRGFNPRYLYADAIKEPIDLYNLKNNKHIL